MEHFVDQTPARRFGSCGAGRLGDITLTWGLQPSSGLQKP